MIFNYTKNLTESLYFGGFVLVSLSIAMPLYFVFKQHLLGAYILVLGTAIGVSGALYLEGRVSFNFLYYFAIILSIPFLIKRNKKFLRDNYILFITVIIIAAITIIITPTNPSYSFLTKEDIYKKMILNASTTLATVVLFSVITVYISRNLLLALLKDKRFAEEEKDKRMVTLSSLGHELRTQINSINGVTQLIMEQKTENKPNKELIETYAKILDKCNEEMLNLVNDVLDIHKIESDKFELIEQPENLHKLLTKISTKFNLLANTKDLKFKSEINSDIANLNLVFDMMRLTQILRNLLRNAVKYTDVGEVTLTVDLIEETDTKASILFIVKDTGIGISKKDYSRIFESFQQIKSENSDIYGGTGLGLSLTKTILDKMDSKIEIESKINQGSIFKFKIDFVKTNKESTIQRIEDLMSNKNCLKGKNILIAEDNNVILQYTDTLLKKYNATTFLAKDGLEAIEMVKNNNEINMVLLDLEMPNLSGLQAIKQLKTLNPEQTIIAFTANMPSEELLKKLYSHGFDDFITKPFKKEELIKTVCLTKRKSPNI